MSADIKKGKVNTKTLKKNKKEKDNTKTLKKHYKH